MQNSISFRTQRSLIIWLNDNLLSYMYTMWGKLHQIIILSNLAQFDKFSQTCTLINFS